MQAIIFQDTSELLKTEAIKVQKAWVDGYLHNQAPIDWSEFVQNPNTSSADEQTNEIVTNCQHNISAADD